MLKTTRVRLFEDAHRGVGLFQKKIEVETWLRENLGPAGVQTGRCWFFRYNRKTSRGGSGVWGEPAIFHLDVYFRNPADATFFKLKWV
jgi:hypothetical protein